MEIKAIFFDLGGVIVRTEDKSARTNLAAEFGMSYEELDSFVFECKTAVLASVGKISAEEHWLDVTRRLKRPESDMPRIRTAFFEGDTVDQDIVQMLRSLRDAYKTGLISNAWDDLRGWITYHQFDDAFDALTISAEIGFAKPDARIYQYALDQLQVKAEQSIFVDDVQKNITGCEALGMHGILFRSSHQVLAEIHQYLTK